MKHGIDDEGEGAARKVRRVSLSVKSLLTGSAMAVRGDWRGMKDEMRDNLLDSRAARVLHDRNLGWPTGVAQLQLLGHFRVLRV